MNPGFWSTILLQPISSRTVRHTLLLAAIALLTWVSTPDHAAAFGNAIAVDLQPAAAQPGFTPIPALQGAGRASQYQGERVNTYGLVTGLTDTGFYLQDPRGDGEPTTSDGLFVYTRSRPALTVGECVAVQGATVEEFYAKTELNRAAAIVPSTSCDTSSIVPVPLPWVLPGESAETVWEPYEGMLVETATELVVHGPAKRFNSGEWEIGVLPSPYRQALPPGHLFHDTQVGEHPAADAVLFLSNRLGATLPEVGWSDRLTTTAPLVGVIDYNFGKYQLLPLPGQLLNHTAALHAPVTARAAQPDEYTVCSFNLHGLGRGSAQYPNAETYAQAVRARAAVIAEQLGGCTIVALQETGAPADAEVLAAALKTDYDLDYAAVALAGPLSADTEFPLTNSFLLRSDRVTSLAHDSIQRCTGRDYDLDVTGGCAAGQYPVFDRPPLVLRVQIDVAAAEPQVLWLINNHWKSKSGDETANADLRAAQAEAVAAYAAGIRSADPAAQIIVLGDLNDFYQGPALDLLTSTGHVDLHDYVPPLARYTYIFNGAAQVLDHVLIGRNMVSQLAGVQIVHSQADAAMTMNTASTRVSDHDPIVVRLRPTEAAALAGNVGLGNVQVTARAAEGSLLVQASSDARGDVRLWGLPPGTIELEIAPPVYGEMIGTQRALTLDLAAGVQQVDLPVTRHRTIRNGARLALATYPLITYIATAQTDAP